ncbi:MAG: ABC transporter substrate-binding protein [Vicinamibacterales bacterium]
MIARLQVAATLLVLTCACGGAPERVLTISGSAVGREADLLRDQLDRYRRLKPSLRIELRSTPDAADQRHQLYVQWLNARANDPDVLQLDVIWTAEFAAAGWIAPLDPFAPDAGAFFPAAVDAQRWQGRLFALPWFIDAGMLYWRSDLMPRAPATLAELVDSATRARAEGAVPFGFVWQGARYEGLVTVFLEHLGAFGGRILDDDSRVVVDSDAAIAALAFMRDTIRRSGIVPEAVLGWQEEQTRFAFQNGQAAFMRNWPYARPLLDDRSSSVVAGRFGVAAMPSGPNGTATAALGGSALAVNAFSEQPGEAWDLVQFLVAPAQMMERARVTGQFPPRPSLYDDPALADALGTDPAAVRAILDRAVARPATPVYSELSEILQVSLHRALSGQQEPEAALRDAAHAMRALLARVKLSRAEP